MKRLLNILVIDSIRELIRYKSFFLLVALLILLDRLLRHYSAKIQFQFDQGNLLDYQWLAIWTYETLPREMMGMLLNWKLWAVAMGLFFLTTDLNVAFERYAPDAPKGRRNVQDLQLPALHPGRSSPLGCTGDLYRWRHRLNLERNRLPDGLVELV